MYRDGLMLLAVQGSQKNEDKLHNLTGGRSEVLLLPNMRKIFAISFIVQLAIASISGEYRYLLLLDVI